MPTGASAVPRDSGRKGEVKEPAPPEPVADEPPPEPAVAIVVKRSVSMKLKVPMLVAAATRPRVGKYAIAVTGAVTSNVSGAALQVMNSSRPSPSSSSPMLPPTPPVVAYLGELLKSASDVLPPPTPPLRSARSPSSWRVSTRSWNFALMYLS